MRRGLRRQVLCAPTGAGKTETAMALVQAVNAKGSTVDFVCDRRALVRQTSRRFDGAGIEHGVLMGDDSRSLHHPVRVVSAQTVAVRGLRPRDLFVVDEAHELRPALLEGIVEQDAWLIGMTATPFPPAMSEFYQAVVNPVTTQALIAEGWLCPFDVAAPVATVDVEGLKAGAGGEWAASDVSRRVLRIVGDVVPDWERHCRERFGGPQPTVVFAASIDDSEALAKEFRAAGHDFRVVSSREPDEKNLETLRRYDAGEFLGLVNCAVLSRGWDAPRTVVLADAYPLRKSLLTLIQRYGRIKRPFQGKRRGLVIDFAENWLAFRSDVLDYYAHGVSELGDGRFSKATRKKVAKGDMICRKCRTVFGADETACSVCGAERPARAARSGLRRKLRVVKGRLEVIDEVTGEIAARQGDVWPHICTASLQACGGDEARARKRAQASHKSIFGRFTRRSFEPLTDPAELDPAVSDLMRRNFQAWLIAKRAREAKNRA